LALTAAVTALGGLTTMQVQALAPTNDEAWATYEIFWYDPDENLDIIGMRSCTSTTTLPGDTTAEKLWNLLASKAQFNDAQIAGVLGNVRAESSYNPLIRSSSGYMGLFQWDKDGRWPPLYAILQAEGLGQYFDGSYTHNSDAVPQGDFDRILEIQIDYALSESRGGWIEKVRSAQTPEEAAEIFLIYFEGAIATKDSQRIPSNQIMHYAPKIGEYYQATTERRTFARELLEQYAGYSGGVVQNIAAIDQNNAIFVGDSRMVGMCSVVNLTHCVAKVGAGYSWLVSDAIAEVNALLPSMPNAPIVINLGVNDLGSVASYASKYRELASGDWAGHKMIILAVSPVGESASVTNESIRTFNANLSAQLAGTGVSHCDATYSSITYSGSDGLHYDTAGYNSIFLAVKDSCGGVASSTAQCGGLVSGGMTVEQAEAFVNFYNTAEDAEVHPYLSGASLGCMGGPRSNCVSFSTYFARKYTNVGLEGQTGGNGKDFAGNLLNWHSGSGWGGGAGEAPQPYAIFSRNYANGGGTQCNGASCGHTGVVLGVNQDAGVVITGEASCGGWGHLQPPQKYQAIVRTYTIDEFMGWYQLFVTYPVLAGGEGLV
jgi:hypothetical protein